MPPADSAVLRAFLSGVARRRAWIAAINGIAIGLVVALILVAFPTLAWPARFGRAAGLAAVGGVIAAFVARKTQGANALDVERRAPECRNIVVTATEIGERNEESYVARVVMSEAARVANALDLAKLF